MLVLKKQLEISDTLIENILPLDNELVKIRKILNWDQMDEVYKSCYRSQRANKTKTTDIVLGLILLKHLYKKTDRALTAQASSKCCLHVSIKRETDYESGKVSYFVLAHSKKYKYPSIAFDLYKKRTKIEERHRQLKGFFSL